MKSFARSLAVIAAGTLLAAASSAQAVTIDFVDIGNAGNAGFVKGADIWGDVAYDFRAGKYEVTNDQYVEMLNATSASDPNAAWDAQQKITRSGVDGSYTYASNAGFEQHPVVKVHWKDAFRFVNWLENGQPTGAQGLTTTEDGTYLISAGSSAVRVSGASFFLPTHDEFSKAAYHYNDGVTANFYNYGTSSDTAPTGGSVPPAGSTDANVANSSTGTTAVGAYSFAVSPYGLFDATGNVDELTEVNMFGLRANRGGGFQTGATNANKTYLNTNNNTAGLGFRIYASVAAPACIIGDGDCDGFVDIAGDILPAFTNFSGPGSFGRTRLEGDVHGPSVATIDPAGHDGDVDVQDLLTMFGAFTGPPPDNGAPDEAGGLAAAEAGDPNVPDLLYDAATGEVTLDIDGSGIIGYVLKNGAGTFAFGNHLQILAGVKTSVAGELSEAAFASSVGANSIGNVFPLGMDLAALTAYLTVNDVSRSLGAPVVPFDLVVLGPAIPEPSTYAMAMVALLGLLAYRRFR